MNEIEEMERQENERRPWNQRAGTYDHHVMQTYEKAYALSIEKVLAHLGPGKRVLEIGCGTGIISLGIAGQAGQVVCVDISREMIARAKQKAAVQGAANLTFRVFDGYALPFEDGGYDLVLMFNILHVVKEPQRLLAEAHRLLTPDGWLVTATDCYAEPVPVHYRLGLTAQKLLKLFRMVPYISYFHIADLRRLFDQAGFSIREEASLHPAPVNYYLAAQKAARSPAAGVVIE